MEVGPGVDAGRLEEAPTPQKRMKGGSRVLTLVVDEFLV